MEERMRLDRFLSVCVEGTRTQFRDMIRSGRVQVDAETVRDPGTKVDAGSAQVCLDGRMLVYKRFRTLMLNKPAGVLTAARDRKQKTVMDLFPALMAQVGCMPAGRLDKDTTGLLIVTSDGNLAHRIISPSWETGKVYEARVTGKATPECIRKLESGMHVADADGEFDALPAQAKILEAGETESIVRLAICEGRYHQVKRMLFACGHPVTALRRLAIGGVWLDPGLPEGGWREMTQEEVFRLSMPACLFEEERN